MADAVAAAVAAAMAEPPDFALGSRTAKSLTTRIMFHPPVFFAGRRVTARFADDEGQVDKLITEWPAEVTLRLRPNSVLRVSLFSAPTSSQPGEAAAEPDICHAPAYIPIQKVMEGGMSLSFCTLWLAVEGTASEAIVPSSAEEVDDMFSTALRRGQELEAPKIGITLKLADDETAEADRLSMFSVVDMYAEAIALIYQRADEKLSWQAVRLNTLEARATSQTADIELDVQQMRQDLEEAFRVQTDSLRLDCDEKQKLNDHLSAEVHTLRLARKDLQRRIARLQEEVMLAWKTPGAQHGGLTPSSKARTPRSATDTIDDKDSVCESSMDALTHISHSGLDSASAIQRAERVAERERRKARALEKELDVLRQELRDVIRQGGEAATPEEAVSTPQSSASMLMDSRLLLEDANTAACVRAQAEMILQLKREVGSLAKSRNEMRRKRDLLEQQLIEARRKHHELERKLEEHEQAIASPLFVPSASGAVTSTSFQEQASSACR
eukprot:TRINITY_DN28855_c0_g2_i1.p1 TRINITY_DN28855_c0_g2~~TRINITY_DN28855_c0_g2_i1.p1  ORF type:complete len:499 (-),score=119.54 TRINITY_DN28855_c0_g2_i1:617-2113(-)